MRALGSGLFRRPGSRRAASAEACAHPPRPWPSPRGRAPGLPPARQARRRLLGRQSHWDVDRNAALSVTRPAPSSRESWLRGPSGRTSPLSVPAVSSLPSGAGRTGCPPPAGPRCPSGTGQCPPARLSREKRWPEEDTVVFPETLCSTPRPQSALGSRQGRRSLLSSRAHTPEPTLPVCSRRHRRTRTATRGVRGQALHLGLRRGRGGAHRKQRGRSPADWGLLPRWPTFHPGARGGPGWTLQVSHPSSHLWLLFSALLLCCPPPPHCDFVAGLPQGRSVPFQPGVQAP